LVQISELWGRIAPFPPGYASGLTKRGFRKGKDKQSRTYTIGHWNGCRLKHIQSKYSRERGKTVIQDNLTKASIREEENLKFERSQRGHSKLFKEAEFVTETFMI